MRDKEPISDEDARLLVRAAKWESVGSVPLTTSRLAEIARAEGLDFATALLHNQILRVPANADFFQRATLLNEQGEIPKETLIGVVPGAFYREHPETGADGSQAFAIARDLGCQAEIVPVGSFGSLEENAEAIAAWIQSRPGRRIVLISLSKGSADVKQALDLPTATSVFANVTGWISISGIVQGTPLVDWLRSRRLRWSGVRLLFWWHRLQTRALEQLRHGPNSPLALWPELPVHLRIVHVYGIPLRRHLTHRWAPRGYERLAPLGPNDGGGILLADLLSLPGIICPIWGADHYLTPSLEMNLRLRRIVVAAIE